MSENSRNEDTADEILHIQDEYPLSPNTPKPMGRVISTPTKMNVSSVIFNDYTFNIETQICKIYQKCQQRKFMHQYSEDASILRSKIIGYPNKLISTLSASIGAVNLVESDFSPYTLAIFAIVSSVLNMTDAYLDYSTKIQKHKIYKSKFIALSNRIESVMVRDINRRPNGVQFLESVTKEYSEYCNGGSPPFSFGAYRALQHEIENNKEFTSIFKLQSLNHVISTPTITPPDTPV